MGFEPSILPAGYEKGLEMTHGLHSLRDGKTQLYWIMATPKNVGAIDKVIVCVHGWTDHTGAMMNACIKTLATLHNAAVIGVDLPGHGRSDGLHLYIPEWFSFVGKVTEFVEDFARREVGRLSEGRAKPLRLFALGESLGGGVVTTMCLLKPQLLDGAILIYPMLDVGKETYPPPLVLWLFKHVFLKLLPTWPVTPNKDVTSLSNRDPAIQAYFRSMLFGAANTKPRLASAFTMAFQAPPWMQAELPRMRTPFLCLHGADDRVTDPDISKRLHAVAEAEDKTLKLYPDAHHGELLQGGHKAQTLVREVYQDIGAWMQQRV